MADDAPAVPGGRLAPAATMAARHHSLPGRRAPAGRERDGVRVSIGRVEVRAVRPAAPPPPRPAPEPARPSQSLDDYLRERDGSLGG
jgi:hypothetical protein